MDDLTQQNAALVEQITTASLAMAQQAHALHEMLGGYRLGERSQAGGVRAVAPSAMPVAGIAGSRAESGSSAAAAAREVLAAPASRPSVRAAGGGEDSAWQDF